MAGGPPAERRRAPRGRPARRRRHRGGLPRRRPRRRRRLRHRARRPPARGGAPPTWSPRCSPATPRRIAPTAHRHRGDAHEQRQAAAAVRSATWRPRSASSLEPELLRARADPPLVRVRERRPAHQRAAGVPRRLGARRGDHHGALPQPPGPARGAAGQAAGQRGQHARAGRRGPPARPGRARRRTCCSARARRPPAAGTRRASWPTRWRRCSARSTCSTGWTPPASVIHRLFDPLMAESAGRGAGAGLEDQPAGADRGARAGRAGVPDRGGRPGPRQDVHRLGGGGRRPVRRRRGAQQEGGRAAGRRGGLADAHRAAPRPTPDGRAGDDAGPAEPGDCRREPSGRWSAPSAAQAERPTTGAGAAGRGRRRPRDGLTCLSCPRWRPSGRAWPSGSSADDRRGRGACTRARSAGTLPGGAHFAAVLAGRTVAGRPPPRQVPVAAAGQRRRGRRPPRHVRPAAAPAGRRAGRDPPAGPVHASPTAARSCASSTSARSAGWRCREGGAELPAEIAHIARDPIDPEFSDAAFVAALRRRRTEVKRALLDQTLISGVGNIYADEALWRARLHGARPTDALTRPGRAAAARPRPRRARRGDRRRAAPASTRSTSTSTARAATSTGRSTSTAARASRAAGAARRSAARRS